MIDHTIGFKKNKKWFTIKVQKGYDYHIEKKRVINEGIDDWVNHLRTKSWWCSNMEYQLTKWAKEV